MQGKVCQCHERAVPSTQPEEEEEEGLEYASKRSYVTPPTAPLELEDIIVQDMLQFSTLPIEEQSGVRECCRMRVVEYMDDLAEIADNKRSESSSSGLLSSSGPSLPALEDQENFPPIHFENLNAIPVPPPVGKSSALHCEWSTRRSFSGRS